MFDVRINLQILSLSCSKKTLMTYFQTLKYVFIKGDSCTHQPHVSIHVLDCAMNHSSICSIWKASSIHLKSEDPAFNQRVWEMSIVIERHATMNKRITYMKICFHPLFKSMYSGTLKVGSLCLAY